MKNLSTVSLLAATLTTGMMAGLFAMVAYSLMPGLGRGSDRTFVEAMQNINRAIQNGWFMFSFLGAIVFAGLAGVLAWRGHGRPALPWIIAGLVLYLVMFLITIAVNVPLNEQLDKAGDPAHLNNLAAVRGDYEGKWVAWNLVRTLANIAAFGCLAWALVVHGAHKEDRSAANDSAAAGHRSAGPEAAPHRQPQQTQTHHQPQPYQPQAR